MEKHGGFSRCYVHYQSWQFCVRMGRGCRQRRNRGSLSFQKPLHETASRSANPCSVGDSGKQTANTWSPLLARSRPGNRHARADKSRRLRLLGGRSFYLSSSLLPMSCPAFRLRRRLEPEHIYSPHLCSVRACAGRRSAPMQSAPFLRFPVPPPRGRPEVAGRRSSRRGRFHRHPMRRRGFLGRLRMNVFKKRAFQAGP